MQQQQPSSARAANKNQLQLYLRLVNHVSPPEKRVLTAAAAVDVAAVAAANVADVAAAALCTLLLVFRLVAIVIWKSRLGVGQFEAESFSKGRLPIEPCCCYSCCCNNCSFFAAHFRSIVS